jgi:hypothetical protein
MADETEQRTLQASLLYHVAKICAEQGKLRCCCRVFAERRSMKRHLAANQLVVRGPSFRSPQLQSSLNVSMHILVGLPFSFEDMICFVIARRPRCEKPAGILAKDLESFAKHGKRATIGVEDVRLCTRRNASLVRLLLRVEARHGCITSFVGPEFRFQTAKLEAVLGPEATPAPPQA